MQTAECQTAVDQLLSYVTHPGAGRSDVDAAIRHMSACAYCQGRLAYLAPALARNEEDRLTCQECEESLPGYLQAELMGQAAEARWSSVTFHLETCPHCSATYADLLDLAAPAFDERSEEPLSTPAPDLAFLRPQPARVNWRLDEVGHLIIEFSANLLSALQPPADQPAYAGGRVRSGRSPRILYQLSLKEAVEDLAVTITAEEAREDATLCTLIVEVDIPSRGGWPNLAGMEVTIRRGELELRTHTTDAFGKALFRDIATQDLAHLAVEIDAAHEP